MAFIVFEGVDGSGKTTLIQALTKVLNEKGVRPVFTREPGGTDVGQDIRKILLTKTENSISPEVEVLLCYADRKQNIDEKIQPALKNKQWVISDRYWASTFAFQCGGRGLSESWILDLKEVICEGCEPDLWILLDLPVEESLLRLSKTGKKRSDRFEKENKNFHQRVRDFYLKLAKKEPEKWLVLDSTQATEILIQKILNQFKKKDWLCLA